jgi:hypothetical protein
MSAYSRCWAGSRVELTVETLALLARDLAGLELSDEDLRHVLPYVRGYLASIARLEALGLDEQDPRAFYYAEDRRWLE